MIVHTLEKSVRHRTPLSVQRSTGDSIKATERRLAEAAGLYSEAVEVAVFPEHTETIASLGSQAARLAQSECRRIGMRLAIGAL